MLGGGNLNGVIAISAGVRHSLALRADGTVWGWGDNAGGQLGDGSTTAKPYAVQMSGVSGAIAVAAGGDHSLILLANGTILACGGNGSGQLGDNTNSTRLTPVPVYNSTTPTVLPNVISVSAGRFCSMALTADGVVYCWGADTWGEMGNGSGDSTIKKIATSITSGFRAISCGLYGSKWALSDQGKLYGWGYNSDGRLGLTDTGVNPTSPTAINQPSGSLIRNFSEGRQVGAFITASGEVYGCGKNTVDGTPTLVYAPWNMQGAMAIAAGGNHTLMLKADGTVWSYGYNYSGQLGDGTTNYRYTPIQVMADAVNPLTSVIAIAAGSAHSMALRADGTVYCWGDNSSGQLGVGSGTSTSLYPVSVYFYLPARSISAASSGSFAIRTDGYVVEWGANSSGQLGIGAPVSPYIAYTPTYAMTSGSGYVWPARAVSGSYQSTLVIQGNGRVVGAGSNGWGQLGNGTFNSTNYFNAVPSGMNEVRQVAVGGYHAIFLLPDGTVKSTGYNYEGVTGDGTSSGDYATPVATPLPGLAKAVTASDAYARISWALLANGTAYGMGQNYSGQMANGTTNNSISPTPLLASSGPDVTQIRICALSGSDNNVQVLLAGGGFKGAGSGGTGQLGNNGSSDSYVLTTPSSTWLPSITLAVSDATAGEAGADTGSVTLTRTLSTVGSLTVSLNYSGTATIGTDYTAPDTLTFGPGAASLTSVAVTPIDDPVDEDTETIIVGITQQTSYGSTSGTATISLLDDDTAGFVLSSTTISTSENAGVATVNVHLASQPTNDVTFAISSLNTQEATVSPTSLTFTAANWNVDQTITVTGVHDFVDDGNQAYTIKLAPASSADGKYNNLKPSNIGGTSVDVDTSGFTITAPTGTTSESGTSATLTVVLKSKPTGNVSIPIASSNTAEATVSPPSLLFTPGNWSTPQTVTMTGVADQVKDGNQSYSITFGPTTSGDANYSAKTPPSKTNTNVDVDVAQVLTSVASLSLKEGDPAAQFTVKLRSKPVGNVAVVLANSDSQILLGTASNAVSQTSLTLTFTNANWNIDQKVFIAAVDDPFIESPHPDSAVSISTTTSVDTVYQALADTALNATMTDNDAFGVLVSKTQLNTDENGSTDTVNITLAAKPTQDVVVHLTIPVIGAISRREGDFTTATPASQTSADTTSVTIHPAEWNTGKTVTVFGIHESPNVQDGNQNYPVTFTTTSADGNFVSATATNLFQVTNVDLDQPGILIQQRNAADTANDTQTVLSESGTTDVYQVRLATAPLAAGAVVIVNILPPAGVTSSPTYLLFTAADYNTFKSVTLTAQDDQVAQGNRSLTVQHSTAFSTDAPYSNLPTSALASLSVNVTDNDNADVQVNPNNNLSTSESGTTSNFSVVLTSQPAVDVVIPLSVSDANEIEISVDGGATYVGSGSLTFTAASWFRAQTVYVRGKPDQIADGNKPWSVVLGAASAVGDTQYNNFDPVDVNGLNLDVDHAGFVVTPLTGLSTTEAGGTTQFTVKLLSKPTDNVTLGVVSTDINEVTVSTSSLAFTPANWSTAQTVTLTGQDDDVADGDRAVSILLLADSTTTDSNYHNHLPPPLTVTNHDNDTAGITVTPQLVGANTTLVTTEAGGTATFTVVLTSQPTSDVNIPLAASPSDELQLSTTALVFTPADWNTPQTVTLTGQDDLNADGDQTVTVALGLAISADATYNGRDPADVTCVNQDDDTANVLVALGAPQAAGRLVTTEAGGTATFTVVLTCQPTGTVSLNLAASDTTQGAPSPASLTFTTADWATPQTVTVSGLANGASEADVDYTITLSDCLSSDSAFNSHFAQAVLMTNWKINNQPTLSPITDQTILEDAAATTITLTGLGAGQSRESAQTLTISAVSDNPTLIPNPTVDQTAGTLTFQPSINNFGTAKITVTVSDNGGTARSGDSDTVAKSFNVSVTAVDDVPAFIPGADVTIAEDAGAQTVAGWATAISAGPANESAQTLSFTATADDATLFAVQPQVDPTSGDLTFTPAADAYGSTTVHVSLQDDGGTANGGVDAVAKTFQLTITAVNDQPTLNALSDLVLFEDDPQQSVALSGITSGAANESQTLSVSAVSDNPALITGLAVTYTSPATTGSLQFTPAANASGTATVTVTVADGGGGSATRVQTFHVQVNAVNDRPQIHTIADLALLEDAATTTVTMTGINDGQAGENQTLTITAVSSDHSLLPDPVITALTGTAPNQSAKLKIKPVAQMSGRATITVTVDDGQDTTQQVFTVTVTPVNDAPTLTALPDLALNEDAGIQHVALTGIGSGAANETQVLTISATSDRTDIIPTPVVNYNAGAAVGQLDFTPVADASGTATITVTIQDDGGTLNGGVDTLVRTFQVVVAPVNDPPTLNALTNLVLNEDAGVQTVVLDGISSGAANEVQTLTVSAVSDDLTLIPNLTASYTSPSATGSLQFTPLADSAGVAHVTVTVSDGGSGTALVTRTFRVLVNPVNDAPVPTTSDPATRKVVIGGSRAITASDLSATDVDGGVAPPSADPSLIFTVALPPGAGQLQRNGVTLNTNDTFTMQDISDGLLTYVHGGGGGATDGFAFTVTDLGIAAGSVLASPLLPATDLAPASSAPQVFSITIDRRPPLVQLLGTAPVFTEGQSGTTLVADAAIVSDADSTTFNGGTIRATVTGVGASAYVLTLHDQGTGTDQVSLSGATVRLNGLDVGTLSGGSGSPLVIACTINMTPVFAQLVLRDLEFSSPGGNPPAATATVTVQIIDDHGDQSTPASQNVVIVPVNNAPTASSPTLVTVANQAIFGVITVTDPDNTAFTFNVTQAPAKGTLSAIAADGSFTYTPAVDQSGNDQFTVVVNDGTVDSAPCVVQVRISGSGTGARPWFISDPPLEVQENDLLRFTAQVSTTGLPGSSISFSLVGAPSGMAVVQSASDAATVTWTAVLGSGNHVAFRVRATDSVSGTTSDLPVLLYIHPLAGGGG